MEHGGPLSLCPLGVGPLQLVVPISVLLPDVSRGNAGSTGVLGTAVHLHCC